MSAPIALNPSRRWALAIGLPFVLVAIGFGALNYVSLVAEDSYRVPATTVPGTGEVTLGVGSGDVAVSPSRDRRSEYSGKVYYSLIKPKLHWQPSSDGAVLAGGPNCFWIGNCGVTLRLSVPPSRAVHASSGSGDVDVSGLTGAVRVGDGSGDVVADNLSGSVRLSDGSGNITGTGLASLRVRASDGSGNVRLSFTKPPEQVRVTDSSGNITVAVPAGVAYYVVAKASSGSTHVDVPQDSRSPRTIYLSDGSGNITVVPSRG